MDLVGFEPTTSSMPWKRAPNCATGPREAKPLQYNACVTGHQSPRGPNPPGQALAEWFRRAAVVWTSGGDENSAGLILSGPESRPA